MLTLCYYLPEFDTWRNLASHALIASDTLGLIDVEDLLELTINHVIERHWCLATFEKVSLPYTVKPGIDRLTGYLLSELDNSPLYTGISQQADTVGLPIAYSKLCGHRYYLTLIQG